MGILESVKILIYRVGKWRVALLLVLMLAASVTEIILIGSVMPLIQKETTKGGVQYQENSNVENVIEMSTGDEINYAIIFISVIIISIVVKIVSQWILNKTLFDFGAKIATDLYDSIMKEDYEWHSTKSGSELIGALNKIPLMITGYFIPLFQGALSFSLAISIVLVVIMTLPVEVVIGVAILLLFYISLTLPVKKVIKRNGDEIAKGSDGRIRATTDALGAIRDIKIGNTYKRYTEDFSKRESNLRSLQAINTFIQSAPRILVEGGALLGLSLIFLFESERESTGQIIPMLGALALAAQRLVPHVQSFYLCWSSIVVNQASLDDILRLMANSSRPSYLPHEENQEVDMLVFKTSIKMKDIEFRYNGSSKPNIIVNNLEIKKGDFVVIGGKTGSGKSTLLDLILCLLKPQKGRIEVDGRVLVDEQMNVAWQKNIAHVPQSPFLFNESILYNITFERDSEKIDQDALRRAIHIACLNELVESKHEGINTKVGENGGALSGGQRQRIAIARAIYKNGDVLVFDEATSALDDQTEKIIMERIKEQLKGVTLIMITHRSDLKVYFDKVLNIADGKIKEEELNAKKNYDKN